MAMDSAKAIPRMETVRTRPKAPEFRPTSYGETPECGIYSSDVLILAGGTISGGAAKSTWSLTGFALLFRGPKLWMIPVPPNWGSAQPEV